MPEKILFISTISTILFVLSAFFLMATTYIFFNSDITKKLKMRIKIELKSNSLETEQLDEGKDYYLEKPTIKEEKISQQVPTLTSEEEEEDGSEETALLKNIANHEQEDDGSSETASLKDIITEYNFPRKESAKGKTNEKSDIGTKLYESDGSTETSLLTTKENELAINANKHNNDVLWIEQTNQMTVENSIKKTQKKGNAK